MFNSPGTFNGVPIVVTENALQQTNVRLFPESRHRSARILKKLIRRFGGEFKKDPAIFNCGGRFVMHPVMYRKLQQSKIEPRDG